MGEFGRVDRFDREFAKEVAAVQRLDEYVKIAEAARILGVAENTLRSWADAGKLRATRNPVNGYRLFRRQDLEAFLKRIGGGGNAKRSSNRKAK